MSKEARGCYTAEVSYLGVVEYVPHRFIGDTHHPSGKPQCGDLHARHQHATVQYDITQLTSTDLPPSAFQLTVSSICAASAQMLAIMRVWQFPPRESLRTCVSLDCL